MTWPRGARRGEDHRPACRAHQMEPPTTMDPVPTLDEEINDPGHREEWGNQIGKKHKDHICICFQNVGGLIPKTDGDLKLTVLRNFSQFNQVDVFAFAEHNICWDLLPKQQQLAEQTRGWWENAQWVTAYKKRGKNPIYYQPGGTRVAIFNALSHRALRPGVDNSGLGCWSWV